MKYTIKADERNIEGKKYCYTCQAWKSVNCFSKDCSKIDGLSSQCKDCKKSKIRYTGINLKIKLKQKNTLETTTRRMKTD